MIKDVSVQELQRHYDDRGYFMELLRGDQNLLDNFGQASISMSYPGVIKAFHYHQHQDDIWFFPSGQAQVVLHDLRKESATYGQTDVHYMGGDKNTTVFIPRGVAHGYRVLGNQASVLVYFTNTPYDAKNPDEFRIDYDDPKIGFDWETKFR